LPAVTPDRATDFLGLKVAACGAFIDFSKN
jgi:hypothetical protein